PRQSGGDAVGDRAGMVLPAVLRHSAVDPEQAPRRYCAVLGDLDPGLPALARHLAGALGPLPAAVQAVLLAVGDRGDRARLAWLQAAGGHLRHPGATAHLLLLRFLPNHPAAARHFREDQTAAELDFGIGAGRA